MHIHSLDLAIVVLYLLGVTALGIYFRRGQQDVRDYFLGGRPAPWWAIALSIVAAETSTLTIISIPGLAYDSNLKFLQVVMGYVVGRVIISFVLLPHYFRGDLFTAYELIERRFGKSLRTLTASLFLLTRAAAEGVRVYAVSIVVTIALGTGEIASIAIITALTLIYTFEGGLAAVIWTDVVQTAIYVGGTLVAVFTILHLVPGGWPAIRHLASEAGKLQIFDFTPDFWKPYTFWAGLIGGTFLTTASHGTDQLIVQRLLAARNQRQSVTALLTSGIVIFFQFALFLIVGLIYERRHTRMISDYGGLSKQMPVYATLFMIITMSSIGLPTLNGFIGEFTILVGAFRIPGEYALTLYPWLGGVRLGGMFWAVCGALGIVLGAAYMLWLYQRTMFGKLDNPENAKLKDLNFREIMTLVPIVICCFWIGLYPKPFFRILEKPVADIAQRLSAGEPSSQTAALPAAPAPSSTIAATTAAEGR